VTDPVRFAIVGSGGSEFHIRMAKAAPDRLQVVAVVTETDAEAQRIAARWGVATVRTIGEASPSSRSSSFQPCPGPPCPGSSASSSLRAPRSCGDAARPELDGLRSLWHDVGAQASSSWRAVHTHAGTRFAAGVSKPGIGTVSREIASTHLYTQFRSSAPSRRRHGRVWSTQDVHGAACRPVELQRMGERPEAGAQDHDDRHARLRAAAWACTTSSRTSGGTRCVHAGSSSAARLGDRRRLRYPAHVGDPVTSPIVYRRTGVDMNLEGNEVVHASFDGRVVFRNQWVGTNCRKTISPSPATMQPSAFWRAMTGRPYPLAQAARTRTGLAIEQSRGLGLT